MIFIKKVVKKCNQIWFHIVLGILGIMCKSHGIEKQQYSVSPVWKMFVIRY